VWLSRKTFVSPFHFFILKKDSKKIENMKIWRKKNKKQKTDSVRSIIDRTVTAKKQKTPFPPESNFREASIHHCNHHSKFVSFFSNLVHLSVIMAVVGIDFGNLSLLIAQAAKGGVDVILNESSNRQTATFVSVQGKQRFIGDSGAAMVRSLSFILSTSHFCFSLVPTWQTLCLW
jgi:hypothetical protein